MMKDYITECFDVFDDDISKHASTPATKELFKIDESLPKLSKAQSDNFHHIIAKLL